MDTRVCRRSPPLSVYRNNTAPAVTKNGGEARVYGRIRCFVRVKPAAEQRPLLYLPLGEDNRRPLQGTTQLLNSPRSGRPLRRTKRNLGRRW
ncbi:hypothetical protein Trydic_g12783 [Trypoxylus dichotomus]